MGVDSFQDSVHRTQSITLSFLWKKKRDKRKGKERKEGDSQGAAAPVFCRFDVVSLVPAGEFFGDGNGVPQ